MHNNIIIEHNLSILGGFYKNGGILLGGCLTCEELSGGGHRGLCELNCDDY